MIARLSKRMASFFVRNEVIKSEDEEVYEYGLQLLLSTIINGMIALILAIFTGTIFQCICYLAVFVLLRKSAGGFHAKTHFGCCCILVVVLSLFIMFIKIVPNEAYGIVAAITVSFSVVIILIFAPLEHKNKPISDRDRSKLRKNSVIYAVLLTILILVLFIVKLKIIMICIALGMFTSSSSMLVAVIEKRTNSIHLRT